MKKQILIVSALILSVGVYSQCNIYGNFNYYPESGGFGWYTFYDVSYGVGLTTAQSYQWKVNGVNAGTNNILHYQFPSSGTYTVCEIITDPVSGCNFPPICKTINIVICPAVNVDFTGSNNGNTYTFVNSSTGTVNPTTYNWTIDGAAVSTASSFNYTFTTSGNHQVCLTLTSGGCTFAKKCYSVLTTICPSFTQNYNYSTTNGGTYTFTNISTGTINNPTYNWKINGASVATTQNMNYTFTNQGTYEVCQYINANGCAYIPVCASLYVCPPILMEVTHTHTGLNYTFTDESRRLDNSPLGGTLTRNWSINTAAQPTHNQTLYYSFPSAGNYTVCLDLLHNSCIYGGYCGSLNISTTDIFSDNFGSDIYIYPNPVQEILHFQLGNLKINTVNIVDVLGRIVYTKEVSDNSDFSVDLPNLAQGVYNVLLNTESGIVVRRIVKQ
ncbi:MAG: T9SS type A sorting domain-containing protein [Bacteroidales bacterium]|nr:T9SS type A sorting domain-containing protein [Bacteroidales bacterium]